MSLTDYQFFKTLKELFKANNRDADTLTFRSNQTVNSIFLFTYKFCHFTVAKNILYICIDCNAQYLLDKYSIPYIKMKSKTDTFPFRIVLDDLNIVNKCAEFWLELFDEKYLRGNNNTYSCCSRWLSCSDSLVCVNPDKADANACKYKRNLEKGLVFYGKNSVLSNGSFDNEKIKRNILNMPKYTINKIEIGESDKYEYEL